MKKNQLNIFLLIIFIAFIGGAVPVFGKIALAEIPTFSFTFIRFLFSTLILLPFYLKTRNSIKGDFWKILGLSLLATGNVLFFAFGVQRTSAGVVQAIYTLSPILAAVLSYFILREQFNLKKLAGILIGFIGALIIIFLPLIEKGLATDVTLLGNILIVIATTLVTLFTVYSKPFHKKYHPVEITTFFSIITMVVMFFFSLFEFQTHPDWWKEVSTTSLMGVIYVGVFGTALYYLLVQHIIKNTTPTLAAMALYIQPFAAIFWAYLFLNEKITMPFIIGITLAIIGVWITLTLKTKHPKNTLINISNTK